MAIEDSTDVLGAIATPPQILWQITKILRFHPFIPLRLKSAIISFYMTI
ncbi:hypothetical protein NG799_27230 [Laspinema sp. D1]|uniref:Uncharacterized protein n=1 Tax=Laspinema palackyanum D2a TaxID=2953684 RepID=A0ABT2N2R0_9CYAN|nr:hypothetical protein [Laspinema sp. D2a]